jgi:hypothetical protein
MAMKVKIGGYPDYKYWLDRLFGWNPKQKISVRIDDHDTWSMDYTLAHIITPMLVQLKATKHGSPMVDMTDVPKELRATKKQLTAYSKTGEADDNYFKRWDWILDEMIWAFEQKCRDNWDEDFYEYEDDDTERFGVKLVWEDREGQKAHQERMSNGFRLFGRYYENLWD